MPLGEPERFGFRSAARNRDPQISVGPDAHHVAPGPPHPDEVDDRLFIRAFRVFGGCVFYAFRGTFLTRVFRGTSLRRVFRVFRGMFRIRVFRVFRG